MYVYVVCEAAGSRPSKIGRTGNNLADRLRQLQNGNSRELRLWWHAYVLRPIQVERRAHSLLLRNRLLGEWFDVTALRAVEVVEEAIALTKGARIEPVPDLPTLPSLDEEKVFQYEAPPVSTQRGSVTAGDITDALKKTGPIPDHRQDWRGFISTRRQIAHLLYKSGREVNSIANALGTSPRMVDRWLKT